MARGLTFTVLRIHLGSVNEQQADAAQARGQQPAASLDVVHTASFRAMLPVEETAQLTFAPWAVSVSITSLFSISAAMCRGVMLDSFMALTWAPFWARMERTG